MNKKLFAAVIAALAVSQGVPVMAAPATNSPANGQHTTIGILEAVSKDISNASFEVPLYITTAAVSNDANLLCPENYDIKNTGTANIGVLSLTVAKAANSTWDTVEADPSDDKKVKLTIGGLTLPEVNTNTSSATVTFLKTQNNCAFYGKTAGKTNKLTAIEANKTLSEAAKTTAADTVTNDGLKITGKVVSKDRTNLKAAAQFKVTYVVSALDDNGDPIGITYAGDDENIAGLK